MSTSPALKSPAARTVSPATNWPRPVARIPEPPVYDEELTLADYGRLLRRWWWLALATFAIVVGAVSAFTYLRAEVYTSEATVLIRTKSSAQLFPLGGSNVVGRTMAAEADFLASSDYLLAAEQAAGNKDEVQIDVGDIVAKVEPSIITFSAKSPTAEQAMATAQAWAQTYIDQRHLIDVTDIAATIESVEATQGALAIERNRVAEPITDLDAQIGATTDATAIANLSAQRVALLQTLNAQLQPIDGQLATANTQLAELTLKAEFLAEPEVSARVNTEAELAEEATTPQPLRDLTLGSVVGLILSVVAVLAVSSIDDRLRSVDDVETATGLGNLAVIPTLRSRARSAELVPGSPTAEAFQRIVSAIDFGTAAGRDQKVLLVTSPLPGEGKTSTAARLATALAKEKRNVVVIGGDLRRPTLSAALGAVEGPGLGDYLTSSTLSLDRCVHQVREGQRLLVMPAGQLHNDQTPAEALRSPDLAQLIDKLRNHCDHVIIDGPPLLPVVDALQLAAVADGVVLSLFAGKSRRRALERAIRLLDEAGPSHVLGYVLSGAKRTEGAYTNGY